MPDRSRPAARSPDGGRPAEPQTTGESFITAALLEIPDNIPLVRLVSCGHPPPLLLSKDKVTALDGGQPAPPLGLSALAEADHRVETFAFEAGDILLLYTDGVIEARDVSGTFFPLAERLTGWAKNHPAPLVHHIREALLAYVGGRLDDDAAIVAIERTSARDPADLPPSARTPSSPRERCLAAHRNRLKNSRISATRRSGSSIAAK
ncbi:MAG TPA: PP2C family protein-serine/threonine phosphatase [Streptosporangiaceae bacterium]|nr:PP2C family protein-serine/threonine phosphatase [Streptosporangiaceae bacterium]